MSDFSLYSESSANVSEAEKRQRAVRAALELINTAVSSGSAAGNLHGLMPHLSSYADLIQEALKTETSNPR